MAEIKLSAGRNVRHMYTIIRPYRQEIEIRQICNLCSKNTKMSCDPQVVALL